MSSIVVVVIIGLAAIGLMRVRALRVRVLEQLDHLAGVLQASLGPMTPEQLIKRALRAVRRAATTTHSGLVLPNVISIAVSAIDFDSWGPLADRLRSELLVALRELATDAEYAVIGVPSITIRRDPAVPSHRPTFAMSLEQATPRVPPRQPVANAKTRPMSRAEGAKIGGQATTHSPSDGVATLHGIDAVPTRRLLVVRVSYSGRPVLESHCGEGPHVGGRNRELCDIYVDHPTVSEVHFEIVVTRAGATIRDLGSTNGTRLRHGQLAAGEIPLHDDDVVMLSREVSVTVLRGATAPKAA